MTHSDRIAAEMLGSALGGVAFVALLFFLGGLVPYPDVLAHLVMQVLAGLMVLITVGLMIVTAALLGFGMRLGFDALMDINVIGLGEDDEMAITARSLAARPDGVSDSNDPPESPPLKDRI